MHNVVSLYRETLHKVLLWYRFTNLLVWKSFLGCTTTQSNFHLNFILINFTFIDFVTKATTNHLDAVSLGCTSSSKSGITVRIKCESHLDCYIQLELGIGSNNSNKSADSHFIQVQANSTNSFQALSQ